MLEATPPLTASSGHASEIKRPRLSDPIPDNRNSQSPKDAPLPHHLTLADLPPEILQHVFSFVDPISLGRLICVNRAFRALLDPSKSLPQPSGRVKQLTMRPQDLIWASSRKTFLRGFPKPMQDMTELDMWRLLRGRLCQFCWKKSKSGELLSTSSPWNAGPGQENVRSIWPFRIRSCGSCLESRIVKVSSFPIPPSDCN